jgi:hypothetical protein
VCVTGVGVNSRCKRRYDNSGEYLKHIAHAATILPLELTGVVGVTLQGMVVSLYFSASVCTEVHRLKTNSSQDLPRVDAMSTRRNEHDVTMHFKSSDTLQLSHTLVIKENYECWK